jgi:hypothetical protein
VNTTDSFKLGVISINALQVQGTTFSVPIALTDADGDSVASAITVSLTAPPMPLVLDLDGDGVEFASLAAGAVFDYGDGTVSTAWAGGDDGILAIDANGNGRVDGGAEIVFGGNGLTDLEGLAASYDSNHDGALDANDAAFAKFGVWQDADGDGTSDAGEFRSLSELGIASIGLTSDGKAYTAENGDVHVFGTASYTRADGSTGAIADAAFATAPLQRIAARSAEFAASNVAAAGVLAAAAASLASLPAAAAEVVRGVVDGGALPDSQAFRALPETHTALRPLGEALLGHDDARAEAIEHAVSRLTTMDQPTRAIAAVEDHAEPVRALDALSEPFHAVAAPFAHPGGAADSGQLMDALLLAAQAGNGAEVAGQHTQDLAAVQEAFGDTQGTALVDAVVAHFAGAEGAAVPFEHAGAGALASLLDANVGGSEAFATPFQFNAMIEDHAAAAAVA